MLFILNEVEYCNIGNVYSFANEEDWNKVIDYLDEHNIAYKRAENSYVGIYMVEVLERQPIE